MPLYEYQCPKCAHRFEKIEKLNAPRKQKCPKCGARAERRITAPAIQFKGSGWYVTDYARAGSAAPKEADGSAAKEAKEFKGEGKGTEAKESKEAKPAEPKKAQPKKK